MLKVTRHLSAAAEPTRHDPHPLAMFLFCMAVKADNYLGARNQPYAIPPLQFNENYHRQWLKATTTSEMHLQYCLATIQLDTISNNVGHLQRQAKELRSSGFPAAEEEIQRRITPMKIDHQAWISRPYVEHHIKNNDVTKRGDFWTKPASLTFRNCFLSYPEYIIFDPLVAYMHLNHTALIIHMSIVEAGHVNPHDNECYDAAVLICRIFAALNVALGGKAGKILNGCSTPLWYAGLVFADKERFSQEAFQWITDTLREIDGGGRYRAAAKLSEALCEINSNGGDPWEIVERKFTRKRRTSSDVDSESPTSSSTGF